MVESGSKQDDSPYPADNEGSSGREMEDEEGRSKGSRRGRWEMCLQTAITPEDYFVRCLKLYWLW